VKKPQERLTPYLLLVVITLSIGLAACGPSETKATTDVSGATTSSPSSWSITPTPTLSSPESNFLNAVFCLSATVCTAVGNDGGATLVETWNGSAWSIVPSPNPKGDPRVGVSPLLQLGLCSIARQAR
jgi:hypothetical protein